MSTMRRELAVVLLAAVAASVAAGTISEDGEANPCEHLFASAGVGFDLSELQNTSRPYEFKWRIYTYKFNLCADLEGGCDGHKCSSANYGPGGNLLNNLGTQSEAVWGLVDSANAAAGVKLTYGGGSTCTLPATVTASTTFNIMCDELALEPTGFEYEPSPCALSVTFRSAHGCPSVYTSGLSAGWVFLVLLLVASLVYFGGGAAYKKATLGTSGLESIPNIDFWRQFFSNAAYGVHRTIGFVTCRKYQELDERDGADLMGDYHRQGDTAL